jgi:uncharacterized alkaline shock family protein YloU
MSGPSLSLGRGVIQEMARHAAARVPGVIRVGRRGPAWRAWLSGPAVGVRIRDGRVHLRLHVHVRAGQPLPAVAAAVRSATAATVERLLGMQLGSVTVVVDGVGA